MSRNQRATGLSLPDDFHRHTVIILDQQDLDEFITLVGGFSELSDDTLVLTDDEFTRGRLEFNLISPYPDHDGYGIGTQVGSHVLHDETVLDLRKRAENSFTEWIMGLM